MLGLHYETPEGWASRALEEPGALLLDHLFCEQKAAAMALAISRRHGEGKPALIKLMEDLAAEEQEHFDQVERLLAGYPPATQPRGGNPYAIGLRRFIHKDGRASFLDKLLVCSLIEARSAERFQLLATELRGSTLGNFYEDLYASEVSHYRLFVELGVDHAGEDRTLERLEELRRFEGQLIASLPSGPRIHSS